MPNIRDYHLYIELDVRVLTEPSSTNVLANIKQLFNCLTLRCYLEKGYFQGSKIVLVRSYLRVSQAAGQVNILIFLLKIKFSPCMPINIVMQGKCLFSDISRPDLEDAKSFPVCK